jgi:hypothetical protein
MDETDERLEDEVEAAEVPEAANGDGEADASPEPADVESIDEILVKKEEAEAAEDEAEEDEAALLAAPRDERVETLSVKVVPPQAGEFVCARCRLVKHRSQLADKGRTLCRDCA